MRGCVLLGLLQVAFDCLIDDQVNHSFANTKVRCTDALVETPEAILPVDPAHTLTARQLPFCPEETYTKMS